MDSTESFNGNCFESNLKLCFSDIVGIFDYVEYCQGVVEGNIPALGRPVKHVHAWVEVTIDDGKVLVFDQSNGKSCVTTRGQYYEAGAIHGSDVRRYDPYDAASRLDDLERWIIDPALDKIQSELEQDLGLPTR